MPATSTSTLCAPPTAPSAPPSAPAAPRCLRAPPPLPLLGLTGLGTSQDDCWQLTNRTLPWENPKARQIANPYHFPNGMKHLVRARPTPCPIPPATPCTALTSAHCRPITSTRKVCGSAYTRRAAASHASSSRRPLATRPSTPSSGPSGAWYALLCRLLLASLLCLLLTLLACASDSTRSV